MEPFEAELQVHGAPLYDVMSQYVPNYSADSSRLYWHYMVFITYSHTELEREVNTRGGLEFSTMRPLILASYLWSGFGLSPLVSYPIFAYNPYPHSAEEFPPTTFAHHHSRFAPRWPAPRSSSLVPVLSG